MIVAWVGGDLRDDPFQCPCFMAGVAKYLQLSLIYYTWKKSWLTLFLPLSYPCMHKKQTIHQQIQKKGEGKKHHVEKKIIIIIIVHK